jgi:hypothetical protein
MTYSRGCTTLRHGLRWPAGRLAPCGPRIRDQRGTLPVQLASVRIGFPLFRARSAGSREGIETVVGVCHLEERAGQLDSAQPTILGQALVTLLREGDPARPSAPCLIP